jgi:hypothetical protein
MRASPYDLKPFAASGNFDTTPVCVETAEGRREYQHLQAAPTFVSTRAIFTHRTVVRFGLQEQVFRKGQSLRVRVLEAYDQVIAEVERKGLHSGSKPSCFKAMWGET